MHDITIDCLFKVAQVTSKQRPGAILVSEYTKMRIIVFCEKNATADLVRKHQILSRGNGIIKKKEEPFHKHHMVQSSFKQKCESECWKTFFQIIKETLPRKQEVL